MSRRAGLEPACCASTWSNLQGGPSPHTSWLPRDRPWVSAHSHPLSVSPTDSHSALGCYFSMFVCVLSFLYPRGEP